MALRKGHSALNQNEIVVYSAYTKAGFDSSTSRTFGAGLPSLNESHPMDHDSISSGHTKIQDPTIETCKSSYGLTLLFSNVIAKT